MLLRKYTPAIYLAVFIAGIFFLPIARLHYGNANFADLGFFVDSISGVANGDYRLAFYGHVQVFMFPLALIAKHLNLSSLPYFLVGLQSAIIILTLLILYFKINKNAGVIFALYFPTWYIALFDFHFDVFVLLISALIFYFIKERKYNSAIIYILLLCLVKEPYCLVALFFCIYALVDNYRNISRKHLFLIVLTGFICIIIFFFITDYLIPHFSNNDKRFEISSSSFSSHGSSILDLILYIVLSPIDFFRSILMDTLKLKYLMILFLAVLFLPLFSLKYLIPAIPIFIISMLSNEPSHYSIRNHYTAGIEIPIVVSAAFGLEYVRRKFKFFHRMAKIIIPIIFLVANFAFTPSPLGMRFYSEKFWDFNYARYQQNFEYIKIIKYLNLALKNSKVDKIYIQNNIFTIFDKSRVSYIDDSIAECANKKCIIVIDKARPFFWADRGCDYIYGVCNNKNNEDIFKAYMNTILSMYMQTYTEEKFVIYERSY